MVFRRFTAGRLRANGVAIHGLESQNSTSFNDISLFLVVSGLLVKRGSDLLNKASSLFVLE